MKKTTSNMLFICVVIIIIATIIVVSKAGYGAVFIILPTLALPIGFVVFIIKSKNDVSRGKSVDGFNICRHNYVHANTKTISYGAGFNKRVYKTYKCTKCGKEITK